MTMPACISSINIYNKNKKLGAGLPFVPTKDIFVYKNCNKNIEKIQSICTIMIKKDKIIK